MVLVFVYGTLRRHEANARLLATATRIAEQAWVYGTLYDTGNGYPALVPSPPDSNRNAKVYGELYRVTTDQLGLLDELEDYREGREDNLYERIVETVYTDDGVYEAYTYVFLPERAAGLQPIPWGDWKCHVHLPHPHHLHGRSSWYYFAYGSCMDTARFVAHGVADLFQDVVGRGVLKGYQLAFSHRSMVDGLGRADVVERGGVVEGKVYRIGPVALDYLFVREGVAQRIYRPAFVDVEVEGRLLEDVLTFVVVNKLEETPPSDEYAEELLRGARTVVSNGYYQHLLERIGRLKRVLR